MGRIRAARSVASVGESERCRCGSCDGCGGKCFRFNNGVVVLVKAIHDEFRMVGPHDASICGSRRLLHGIRYQTSPCGSQNKFQDLMNDFYDLRDRVSVRYVDVLSTALRDLLRIVLRIVEDQHALHALQSASQHTNPDLQEVIQCLRVADSMLTDSMQFGVWTP